MEKEQNLRNMITGAPGEPIKIFSMDGVRGLFVVAPEAVDQAMVDEAIAEYRDELIQNFDGQPVEMLRLKSEEAEAYANYLATPAGASHREVAPEPQVPKLTFTGTLDDFGPDPHTAGFDH